MELTVYFLDENRKDIDSVTLYEYNLMRILQKYLPKYYVRYSERINDVSFVNTLLYALYKERQIHQLWYRELRAKVKCIEIVVKVKRD